MISFISDVARCVAIRIELAEAQALLDRWRYPAAREKAQSALRRAQSLNKPNPPLGRCYALLAEIDRREGSGPFGFITEPEVATRCLPNFMLAVDNLEPALGADSREVQQALFYAAFVLSQRERFEEALPLWRRIVARRESSGDREGLLSPLWRLGQALRQTGNTEEALHVLRRQVSLESEYLDNDDCKKMNVQDMLMFDNYRGSFELAVLLIEQGLFDEAEPLLRYLKEAADRPSCCRDDSELNRPADRVRELLAELAYQRGNRQAAQQAHLERAQLALAVKPRPFLNDAGPLTEILDSIDAFYRERRVPAPIYVELEARVASCQTKVRADIALRAAAALAFSGDYDGALQALDRAAAQKADRQQLDKLRLVYLVLAGKNDHAAKLAAALL